MTSQDEAQRNELLKKARHMGFIMQATEQAKQATKVNGKNEPQVKSASEQEAEVTELYKVYSKKDEARIEKFAKLRECFIADNEAA